jgi:hypothetical protein
VQVSFIFESLARAIDDVPPGLQTLQFQYPKSVDMSQPDSDDKSVTVRAKRALDRPAPVGAMRKTMSFDGGVALCLAQQRRVPIPKVDQSGAQLE